MKHLRRTKHRTKRARSVHEKITCRAAGAMPQVRRAVGGHWL